MQTLSAEFPRKPRSMTNTNTPPGENRLDSQDFLEDNSMIIEIPGGKGSTINEVYKALSDPTRREILRLLSAGEKTAGELAEQFDMTKPTVSHHFATLKKAELIRSRRDGQQIYYALNTTVIQDVLARMLDLLGNTGDVPGQETKNHVHRNQE